MTLRSRDRLSLLAMSELRLLALRELSLHLLRGNHDARVTVAEPELRLGGVAEAAREGLHARHVAEGRGEVRVVDWLGPRAAGAPGL
eukprot:3361781-Rhodomonas_salina.1